MKGAKGRGRAEIGAGGGGVKLICEKIRGKNLQKSEFFNKLVYGKVFKKGRRRVNTLKKYYDCVHGSIKIS